MTTLIIQGKEFDINNFEEVQAAIETLETELSRLLAENQGLRTKIEEMKAQLESSESKTDSNFDHLVGERLQVWSEVLPHFRQDDSGYLPDYSLSPPQVKVAYLSSLNHDKAEWKVGLQERKDELLGDSPSAPTIAFVEGLYSVLKPDSVGYKKRSHTDEVLGSIMFGRHLDAVNSKEADINFSQRYREKIEAKNPK